MKRAGVFLKAGLMLVVVAFVAWTAWDLGKRWQEAPAVAPHMGWLLLSCVPIALVSLAQALGWQSLIVRMAGRPLPAWLSMELFLASMLGRYAPAKVGMAAVLISRAKQLQLSAALMGSAMLLIVLVYAILGAGMGLGTMTLTEGAVIPPQLEALRSGLGWLALGGMALVVVMLLVVDRRRYPAIVLRLLRLSGEGPLVGPGVVFWYGTV